MPGKKGPVELSAVIFHRKDMIIPEGILSTLPNVTFEIKPEEPKQAVATASSIPLPVGSASASLNDVTPDILGDPLG